MPSKKKKYNSRFPPARIKKIMQTDEDIGKVAAAVPVLISKCLEMFLTSLLTKAGDVTKSKRAKTMSRMHLKECIMSETMFDFLQDQVAHIQDLQGDEETPMTSALVPETEMPSKISRKRSLAKPKKNTKKRARRLNEGSDLESDGGEEDSDNVSGNEKGESPYSSGLMSPVIKRNLGTQSVADTVPGESTASSSKSSHPIHIPLDVLMAKSEIPASLKVERSVSMPVGNVMPIAAKTNSDNKTTTKSEIFVENISPKLDLPCVRQGVIVANSSAHGATYSSPAAVRTPFDTNEVPNASLNSKQDSRMIVKDRLAEDSQRKLIQENYPLVDSQRESMLSLLQSSMPISAPITSDNPTVHSNTHSTLHEKYTYNPLSQHPRLPLYYSNLQTTPNGNLVSSYSKQAPPYVPPATQRHFLGYTQTMLTPPGQNPLLAVHSGMAQMKPIPRSRSDDDDDYDT